MNLIAEWKAFYDWVELNQVTTGQIALWQALLYINNKCAWQDWFTVSNLKLQLLTGLSRQAIVKCRNLLKQKGLLDFRVNGSKATAYHLISLEERARAARSEAAALSNSSQQSSQESSQASLQSGADIANSSQPSFRSGLRSGCQGGFRNGSPLIDLDGNRNIDKKESENTLSPTKEDAFVHFWQIYPRKTAKKKALESWEKAVKKAAAAVILQGAQAFAAWCERNGEEPQFIPHPATWLNQERWEDVLVDKAPLRSAWEKEREEGLREQNAAFEQLKALAVQKQEKQALALAASEEEVEPYDLEQDG